MIKALIAWGIGFGSGIKYVITRGLEIGAAAIAPVTPANRTLIVGADNRVCTITDSLVYLVLEETREVDA